MEKLKRPVTSESSSWQNSRQAWRKIPQVVSNLMTASHHGSSHVIISKMCCLKEFCVEVLVLPKPLLALKREPFNSLNTETLTIKNGINTSLYCKYIFRYLDLMFWLKNSYECFYCNRLKYWWWDNDDLPVCCIFFFFQIFYPETTDVYDRKNMPKVVYCIHALR